MFNLNGLNGVSLPHNITAVKIDVEENKKKLLLAQEVFQLIYNTTDEALTELFGEYDIYNSDKDMTENCNDLMKTFNIAELESLIVDLQIFRITYQNPLHVDSLANWLQLSSLFEIFCKDNQENVLGKLCNRIDTFRLYQTPGSTFEEITNHLHEQTINELKGDCLFWELEDKFEENKNTFIKNKEKLEKHRKNYYDKLIPSNKFRWILLYNLLKEKKTNLSQIPIWIKENKGAYYLLKCLILATNSDEIKTKQKYLSGQMKLFERYPFKMMPTSLSFLSLTPSCSSTQSLEPELLIGMPPKMPNGGNTCYISSTLWAVYTLLHQEISETMERELHLLQNAGSNLRKNALEKLQELFIALNSKPHDLNDAKPITAAQMDDLRNAILRFSPRAFVFPMAKTQEDAYDFLVCLMSELLALDSCVGNSKKFALIHSYEKIDNGPVPDIYNLEESLESTKNPEPVLLIDIRLPDKSIENKKLKLSDLVTKRHKTEIIDRHAYLNKPSNDESLHHYFPFNAVHHEQMVIESEKKAPEYFIGRLTRFTKIEGVEIKRMDCVEPEASLEFTTVLENGTVAYDLHAATIHVGGNTNVGHYYSYLRVNDKGNWSFYRYDDLDGISLCSDLDFIRDASFNGYIFYYKKREESSLPPSILPEFSWSASPLKRKAARESEENAELKFQKVDHNQDKRCEELCQLVCEIDEDDITDLFKILDIDLFDEMDTNFDNIKNKLQIEEISSLISDLELFQMSKGDFLPDMNIDEFSNWLGIPSFYKLLDKNDPSDKIKKLCERLESYHEMGPLSTPFEKISSFLRKWIKNHLLTASLIERVESEFEIESSDIEKLKEQFDKMPIGDRFCWNLFFGGVKSLEHIEMPAYIQQDVFARSLIQLINTFS